LVANSCTASSTRSLPRGIPNWRYWSAMSRRPFPRALVLRAHCATAHSPVHPSGRPWRGRLWGWGHQDSRKDYSLPTYAFSAGSAPWAHSRADQGVVVLRPRNTHLAPRQSPARSPSERLYGSG
jgi:hypothetical protein